MALSLKVQQQAGLAGLQQRRSAAPLVGRRGMVVAQAKAGNWMPGMETPEWLPETLPGKGAWRGSDGDAARDGRTGPTASRGGGCSGPLSRERTYTVKGRTGQREHASRGGGGGGALVREAEMLRDGRHPHARSRTAHTLACAHG